MWVTAVIQSHPKKNNYRKEGTGILNFINVFTALQSAFWRSKYTDLWDTNIYKTNFLSSVCQFELPQSRAQSARFIPASLLSYTQGSCSLFMPTLTSSDAEASLKYSLAIFSNPHIHSLWLCWEKHSVRAERSLNRSVFRAFPSQQQCFSPSTLQSYTQTWQQFSS